MTTNTYVRPYPLSLYSTKDFSNPAFNKIIPFSEDALQFFKKSDTLTIGEGNNRYVRLILRTNDGSAVASGIYENIVSPLNISGFIRWATIPSWSVYKKGMAEQFNPNVYITYNSRLISDTFCSVNLATGLVSIQFTGRYYITFSAFTSNGNVGQYNEILLYRNGVDINVRNFTQTPTVVFYDGLDIMVVINLNAGDTVGAYIRSFGSVHGNENCYFSGFYIGEQT